MKYSGYLIDTANKIYENYAVFKLTAEGPLGPSSTSKVKA